VQLFVGQKVICVDDRPILPSLWTDEAIPRKAQRGATFKSLADAWADTTTPHGRLILTVIGRRLAIERSLHTVSSTMGWRLRSAAAALSSSS
jgi:hypothetical protein